MLFQKKELSELTNPHHDWDRIYEVTREKNLRDSIASIDGGNPLTFASPQPPGSDITEYSPFGGARDSYAATMEYFHKKDLEGAAVPAITIGFVRDLPERLFEQRLSTVVRVKHPKIAEFNAIFTRYRHDRPWYLVIILAAAGVNDSSYYDRPFMYMYTLSMKYPNSIPQMFMDCQRTVYDIYDPRTIETSKHLIRWAFQYSTKPLIFQESYNSILKAEVFPVERVSPPDFFQLPPRCITTKGDPICTTSKPKFKGLGTISKPVDYNNYLETRPALGSLHVMPIRDVSEVNQVAIMAHRLDSRVMDHESPFFQEWRAFLRAFQLEQKQEVLIRYRKNVCDFDIREVMDSAMNGAKRTQNNHPGYGLYHRVMYALKPNVPFMDPYIDDYNNWRRTVLAYDPKPKSIADYRRTKAGVTELSHDVEIEKHTILVAYANDGVNPTGVTTWDLETGPGHVTAPILGYAAVKLTYMKANKIYKALGVNHATEMEWSAKAKKGLSYCEVGTLVSMAVVPEYRNYGIGAALLNEARSVYTLSPFSVMIHEPSPQNGRAYTEEWNNLSSEAKDSINERSHGDGLFPFRFMQRQSKQHNANCSITSMKVRRSKDTFERKDFLQFIFPAKRFENLARE